MCNPPPPSYALACAQFEPMVEQTITHYAADGWLLHTSDHDAKRQMDMDRMEQEAATKYQTDVSGFVASDISCVTQLCSLGGVVGRRMWAAGEQAV